MSHMDQFILGLVLGLLDTGSRTAKTQLAEQASSFAASATGLLRGVRQSTEHPHDHPDSEREDCQEQVEHVGCRWL